MFNPAHGSRRPFDFKKGRTVSYRSGEERETNSVFFLIHELEFLLLFAFEFELSSHSLTENLNELHSTGIIADGNKDGVVNVLDLNGFTQIFLEEVSLAQPCYWSCWFGVLHLQLSRKIERGRGHRMKS